MSEREYRRDNSRKRDSDEGDIARYERYRYGGDNSQYNDLDSTWSIEELVNTPDDIDGTLNHTGSESLDKSSLPKMDWELENYFSKQPVKRRTRL